jgi:hypothetical protein
LEISGKRYISARRAAKEYKYHSDYIGQLIRGKKLLGRKVGRSWYVELESMQAFFGNEGSSIPPAPIVAKAVTTSQPINYKEKEEIIQEREVEKPEPRVEEVVMTRIPEPTIKVNKAFAVDETARDSFHIPVRVNRPSFASASGGASMSSLTYVSDEESYMPFNRRPQSSIAHTMVMPQSEEEVDAYIEDVPAPKQESYIPYKTPATKKNNFILPTLSVLVLGALIFLVAVGSSMLVSSRTTIEAGKGASAGYSIK